MILIVSVAVRWKRLIISMPKPYRHNDVLRVLYGMDEEAAAECDQGFLTSRGEFVGREAAQEIVFANRQEVIGSHHETQLFSEDLW